MLLYAGQLEWQNPKPQSSQQQDLLRPQQQGVRAIPRDKSAGNGHGSGIAKPPVTSGGDVSGNLEACALDLRNERTIQGDADIICPQGAVTAGTLRPCTSTKPIGQLLPPTEVLDGDDAHQSALAELATERCAGILLVVCDTGAGIAK